MGLVHFNQDVSVLAFEVELDCDEGSECGIIFRRRRAVTVPKSGRPLSSACRMCPSMQSHVDKSEHARHRAQVNQEDVLKDNAELLPFPIHFKKSPVPDLKSILKPSTSKFPASPAGLTATVRLTPVCSNLGPVEEQPAEPNPNAHLFLAQYDLETERRQQGTKRPRDADEDPDQHGDRSAKAMRMSGTGPERSAVETFAGHFDFDLCMLCYKKRPGHHTIGRTRHWHSAHDRGQECRPCRICRRPVRPRWVSLDLINVPRQPVLVRSPTTAGLASLRSPQSACARKSGETVASTAHDDQADTQADTAESDTELEAEGGPVDDTIAETNSQPNATKWPPVGTAARTTRTTRTTESSAAAKAQPNTSPLLEAESAIDQLTETTKAPMAPTKAPETLQSAETSTSSTMAKALATDSPLDELELHVPGSFDSPAPFGDAQRQTSATTTPPRRGRPFKVTKMYACDKCKRRVHTGFPCRSDPTRFMALYKSK